jgi:hypothetical protein
VLSCPQAWWSVLQQAQQQRAQQRTLLSRCLSSWAALSQQRCLALEAAEAGVVPYEWRLAAAALAAWRQQVGGPGWHIMQSCLHRHLNLL